MPCRSCPQRYNQAHRRYAQAARLHCCYDCSTTFVLKNLSVIPKELTPEIKIMLELFRDLAQKDGVNIIIEHAEASDISDYLI